MEEQMYYWDLGMGFWLLLSSAPGMPSNRFLKAVYLTLGCWMIANAWRLV